MSVFKRGSKYWYQFRFLGSRVQESAHTSNREIAERKERARRRELELGAGGLSEVKRPVIFEKAAKEWLEGNPHWTDSTREISKLKVKRLTAYFGKMFVNDIQAADVATYQRQRQKDGAAPRTCNMEVSALRQILREHGRWAFLEGKVKMLRESEEIGRALTADELHRLEVQAKKSRSRSLPVAITMLRHTGMRVSELRTMRWYQVDFLARSVRVGRAKTKGSEGRLIPLNETAFRALKEWRARFENPQPDHFIFPSERYGFDGEEGRLHGAVAVWNINPEKPIGSWKVAWTECRKRAGVNCRLHDLRHTFCSLLAEAQVADSTLMALTGHMSKRMLEHYSHVRNEAKRAAVSALDAAISPVLEPADVLQKRLQSPVEDAPQVQ
ncbi:MAG: tyrosine-type recombinase/integrase [Acidobacteriota bacterium]